MTSVKSQAEIHEWKCASQGSAFERAGEARDSARPRRTARFFRSRGLPARSPALISDRDPFPTQARETAAASNSHFGAAPGAPASAPSRGHPPTLASPRIPESCGQNKSKRPEASDCFSDGEHPGKRLKPARDPAPWSNPIGCRQPPALSSRFRLRIAEPGKAAGLPPSPPSRAPRAPALGPREGRMGASVG